MIASDKDMPSLGFRSNLLTRLEFALQDVHHWLPTCLHRSLLRSNRRLVNQLLVTVFRFRWLSNKWEVGRVHRRVSENLHDVLDDEPNEAVRPDDANESSWNRLHVMEGHNQERSVDVPVAKLQRNQGEHQDDAWRKTRVFWRKHGEEIGYGHLQIQLDLFVRQVLHIQVFREERVRFSCGETHNVDRPQATPPNNAAMLHTTGKFHFSGTLHAST